MRLLPTLIWSLALITGAAAQDGDIKIGVHTSLTGKASFVGQGAQVGLELATAEINDHGGINGRKIDLIIADDRGTTDGGVAAVRRLIEQDNVLAVFGAGISTSTVSVVPLFLQNDVPYLVSFASDPRVLEHFRPNIFLGATLPAKDYVRVYTDFAADKLGAKRVALMLCDQAQCVSTGPLMEAAWKAKGVEVTTANFNSGDTDFTGQVYAVKDANPDAVFVYGLPADGGRVFQQLRRAGVTAPIIGDAALADPAVAEVAGAAAEGYYSFYVGGVQLVTDNTGAMAQFLSGLDKYDVERPQNTPNFFSAMAYADLYVLAEAIRSAGENPSRESVSKNLETKITDFVGGKTPEWAYAAPIGLPRTFTTEDHQGNRNAQVVTWKQGKFSPAD